MNSVLYGALSALDTFSHGWQTIANNVANVSTDGFRYGTARYQEAPNGQGVQLSEISTSTSPGSPLPGALSEGQGDYVNQTSMERAQAAAAASASEAAARTRAAEARESSNVQIEREFTQAIITEQAFAANAAVVSTYADMMGTVIDIQV